MLRFIVVAFLFASFITARPIVAAKVDWAMAENSHFQVYSQSGPERAQTAMVWFEELRSFFDEHRIIAVRRSAESRPPLKVIGFSSKAEYGVYKLRASSDAYFAGTGNRDYIVMPILGPEDFSIAAHEYAHYVLHASGLLLPAWLGEGIAEVFSTVQITRNRCELGGLLPQHLTVLRRSAWLPPSDLLSRRSDATTQGTRENAGLFYAESWAVTDMLVSSPDYAPRFGSLIDALIAGEESARAFGTVYGKTPDTVLTDAKSWIARGNSSRRTLSAVTATSSPLSLRTLSPFEAQSLMGELELANGKWDSADTIYSGLLQKAPNDPDILASLGTTALYRGNREGAITYWHRALAANIRDPELCFRYALLADQANLPTQEIKNALRQAIRNKPDYDDARFALALRESNDSEYADAVEQFRAMPVPAGPRAFPYWCALSYALAQLDRREEAIAAAQEASHVAGTPDEHARAAELLFVAQTDLTVQFSRDAKGQQQMNTTRVPHGTENRNPFIEPGDHIRRVTGRLREVQCQAGQLTGFVVETSGALVSLSVPDPLHVLIRGGPPEFSCGSQAGPEVKADYATLAGSQTSGLLRGMQF